MSLGSWGETLPPLYILRHGETGWNRDGRIQGQMQSHLTETGRWQAEQQGAALARLLDAETPPDIFASPLARCRETAEIALGARYRDVVFDERLMEVGLGDWEGHLRSDLARHYPVLADPDMSVFEQCFHAPGGESFELLALRIIDFLSEVRGPTIVVTHGVAGAVLRGLVQGLDISGMAALDHRQGVVLKVESGTEALLLG